MNTPSPKVLPKMVAGRSLAYLGLQPWEHRHETVEEREPAALTTAAAHPWVPWPTL